MEEPTVNFCTLSTTSDEDLGSSEKCMELFQSIISTLQETDDAAKFQYRSNILLDALHLQHSLRRSAMNNDAETTAKIAEMVMDLVLKKQAFHPQATVAITKQFLTNWPASCGAIVEKLSQVVVTFISKASFGGDYMEDVTECLVFLFLYKTAKEREVLQMEMIGSIAVTITNILSNLHSESFEVLGEFSHFPQLKMGKIDAQDERKRSDCIRQCCILLNFLPKLRKRRREWPTASSVRVHWINCLTEILKFISYYAEEKGDSLMIIEKYTLSALAFVFESPQNLVAHLLMNESILESCVSILKRKFTTFEDGICSGEVLSLNVKHDVYNLSILCIQQLNSMDLKMSFFCRIAEFCLKDLIEYEKFISQNQIALCEDFQLSGCSCPDMKCMSIFYCLKLLSTSYDVFGRENLTARNIHVTKLKQFHLLCKDSLCIMISLSKTFQRALARYDKPKRPPTFRDKILIQMCFNFQSMLKNPDNPDSFFLLNYALDVISEWKPYVGSETASILPKLEDDIKYSYLLRCRPLIRDFDANQNISTCAIEHMWVPE